ncbi:replicative DNA helicase [Actinomadura logoneensis]|uniref:Replicative DNA helicase n=1 Tax=Actinomadura logoneensis TaxID=2293572 RepID=A0A372JRG7_9ACTN|nr:replicative DNA helicase [Actinomadura logoneensis]RFU42597.1 replicative DNA helicase [Actinomadura logoneensis]
MSVSELEPGDREFERTPPHDIAAEQGVLGGMLLSQDAIAEVIEVLRTADFYRPAHQIIFDAVLELYGRGDPADAVTIAGELTKRGEIGRVGGAPYLHTLISSVPTAANAGYYARIVRERSVLRKLVETGTRIVQMGYNADGADADEILDRAQAEVFAIAEKRSGEDYVPLSEIMPGALDEIEAIGSRGGQMVGVPTGFADLDALTNGLHPGQMIVVAARPAMGKALALATLVPTPSGWTTMGALQVGDEVLDADGRPTRVVAATEVMHGRPCYEVEFSDGEVVVADALHQWRTAVAGETAVRTTERIAASLDETHVIDGPGERVTKIVDVRPVPSVPVRCVQVDNADHMYLVGRSRVPTHNSTLALDFARAASIKHGLTSAFFSLEMGRNEITMRLLSAEARVALHAMRSGTMQDEDWTRLARRMSEVAEAPLFIDDSPNMSMMEIRAKARRLKQQHDLRLVVIDYLQLMTSGKRVESRQVEVSEFSRSLKLLAKELQVPVIALSQLNRGPEQRTDKKPMVSDLRESGCVTAATRLVRADTGAEVTIGELAASGARDVPVWALDDRLKYVPRTMTHAFPSGRKEAFRVTLASGRRVEATANHPFLTHAGWTPLGELSPGDRVAAARHVPPPLEIRPWPEERVVLLAHLLGGGSFGHGEPVRYAGTDEACLSAVTDAARHFGVIAVRDEHDASRGTTLRVTQGSGGPIAEWLDDLGLLGLRAPERFVPDEVFGLPKEQVALFLRHLWAAGGSVDWDAERGRCGVHFSSAGRRLVEDASRLLLRFGILPRVETVREAGGTVGGAGDILRETGGTVRGAGETVRGAGDRPVHRLRIDGAENQLAFFSAVRVLGARGVVAATAAKALRGARSNAGLDTIPADVWGDVRQVLQSQEARELVPAGGGAGEGTTVKAAPGGQRLGRVAAVLGDAELEMLAVNDIVWDEIVSVESVGEQEVYDATVMGLHNFVANGIALHNSIEQDADMVILLHREDAYEKESPRAGEADLIVAKHRNGPTATVTVAFQGHYSRFVDMAQ